MSRRPKGPVPTASFVTAMDGQAHTITISGSRAPELADLLNIYLQGCFHGTSSPARGTGTPPVLGPLNHPRDPEHE